MANCKQLQTKLSAARKTVTRLQLKEENVQKYKREVNAASIERKSLEKQLNHEKIKLVPNICNIECLFYFVFFYFCDRSQAFKDNYHGAVIESKKVLATNNAVKKAMEKELKRKQKQVERLQAKEVSLMSLKREANLATIQTTSLSLELKLEQER